MIDHADRRFEDFDLLSVKCCLVQASTYRYNETFKSYKIIIYFSKNKTFLTYAIIGMQNNSKGGLVHNYAIFLSSLLTHKKLIGRRFNIL